jgi:tRNA threonylcarbamoyl adenosine modification protein YeaZ
MKNPPDFTRGNSLSRYGLAIHTSGPRLGLAIDNRQGDREFRSWDLDRDLSNFLHQHLREFLVPRTWEDVEFLAVAKGPGSFTSTRVGIVTARTLAQQFDLPLYPISSLAAYARSRREYYPDGTYLALQMPATREKIYTAIYRGDSVYLADTLTAPEAWSSTLKGLTVPYQFLEVPNDLGCTALDLLDLAYLDRDAGKPGYWADALPFYGG